MKKLLSIILTAFMFVSNTCVVFANEKAELYAYTTNTEEFDAYAKEKINLFITSYYGFTDTSLELGKGIKIVSENNYEQVFYPIWKNNDIVAKFIVANVDGVYSGTFSTTQAIRLNDIKELTSFDNPLVLIGENGLFAKIGDDLYNLNSEVKEDVILKSNINVKQMAIINANEKIKNTVTVNNNRAAPEYSSKNLSWSVYATQPTLTDGYCASYCLYNVLRNMSISDYSLSTIKSAVGNYGLQQENVVSFLKNRSFTYSNQLNSGYLSTSSVKSGINNNKYIIMYVRNTVATYNSSTGLNEYIGHTMVLYGYTIDPTAGNTYKVWDPIYSSYKIMDADTRLVTSDSTHIYRWNNGYIYNIVKH